MTGSIAATRLATLAGDFDRNPAYAGLADALPPADRRRPGRHRPAAPERARPQRRARRLADDGDPGVRRPCVETGYAVARQGSGTYTRVPGGRRQALDRTLTPHAGDDDVDRPQLRGAARHRPGIAAAYADAAADLPPYLGGHGYFPTGLPALQEAIAATYDERGLPTDPAQILVVPGALSALMVVAQAPGRHRATGCSSSLRATRTRTPRSRRAGARRVAVPMDVDGWDLDAVGRVARQASPRLAYLIPDFQNPTGNLMGNAQREQYAALLRRTDTIPVVDESHVALCLDGRPMPRPFATFAPDTITLGSASKSLWGGLRVGWIRSPLPPGRAPGRPPASRSTSARPSTSSWSPRGCSSAARSSGRANRARLRVQRDALVAAISERLPDWRFRVPRGGLSLWCELPPPADAAAPTALAAEAERRGVVVSPGPVFAVDGGLDSFVRIPFTRPADELRDAVDRLADGLGAPSATPPRGDAGPAYPRDGRLSRRAARPLRPGRRARSVVASMACSISARASAGIAESTDSATRAWPPLLSRETCMPAMLTVAVAEDPADGADHARTVGVGEERQVVGGLEVDREVVDGHQPLALCDADEGAADRDLRAVGEGAADRDQVAVVGALALGDEADGGARARPRAAAR